MPSIYHDDDRVQAGITRALGEVLRRMREGTDNPQETLRQLQAMAQRPVPFTATLLLGNMESPCPPVAWDTGDTVVVHGHPSGPTDSLLRISPDGQQQVLKTLVRPFLDKLLIFAGGALINDGPKPVLILMNGQNVTPTAVPMATFQSQGNVLWMNEGRELVSRMVAGVHQGPEINDRQKWCPITGGVMITSQDSKMAIWARDMGWQHVPFTNPILTDQYGVSELVSGQLMFMNAEHRGAILIPYPAIESRQYWHHPHGIIAPFAHSDETRCRLVLTPLPSRSDKAVLHENVRQPRNGSLNVRVSHQGAVLFNDGPNLYWWHYHDLHPSSRTDLLFDDLRQDDRFYHHPLGALLVRREENYEDLWLLQPKIKK